VKPLGFSAGFTSRPCHFWFIRSRALFPLFFFVHRVVVSNCRLLIPFFPRISARSRFLLFAILIGFGHLVTLFLVWSIFYLFLSFFVVVFSLWENRSLACLCFTGSIAFFFFPRSSSPPLITAHEAFSFGPPVSRNVGALVVAAPGFLRRSFLVPATNTHFFPHCIFFHYFPLLFPPSQVQISPSFSRFSCGLSFSPPIFFGFASSGRPYPAGFFFFPDDSPCPAVRLFVFFHGLDPPHNPQFCWNSSCKCPVFSVVVPPA